MRAPTCGVAKLLVTILSRPAAQAAWRGRPRWFHNTFLGRAAYRSSPARCDAYNDELPDHGRRPEADQLFSQSAFANHEQKPLFTRIHIIGLGALGKLVAAALRDLPEPPPVTLLTHHHYVLKAWQNSPRTITVERHGQEHVTDGFDMEVVPSIQRAHGVPVNIEDLRLLEGLELPHQAALRLAAQSVPEDELVPLDSSDAISCLIVTTKAPQTVAALLGLRHRLHPTSTIAFLQNGIGVQDQVNKHVFPDPAQRPNYVLGVVHHGVKTPRQNSLFCTVHNSRHGTIMLGSSLQSNAESSASPTADNVINALVACRGLRASHLSAEDFHIEQFRKLALNAVINPLTALLDGRNGALLYSFPHTKLMRLLISEISYILRSLPEIVEISAHSPDLIRKFFSPIAIEHYVLGILRSTRDNISSMLADVRRGHKTEIEYINGYLVKRAREMGTNALLNAFLVEAVKGKQLMISRERREEVPIKDD